MSEPIPISLLSEYVFCPRSAWLSYAAGVFQPNEFTVEGELLHHRVHAHGTDQRRDRRQWRKIPLRWAQFRAAADKAQRLAIAKDIVRGKLHNQRAMLQRSAREGAGGLDKGIRQLRALIQWVDRAEDLDELRGIEGAGAATYFRELPKMIKTFGFPFSGRIRRRLLSDTAIFVGWDE